MSQSNLDLRSMASKVNVSTVALQDYAQITPSLAKVILTTSSMAAQTKAQRRAAIASIFGNKASAVEDSFRSEQGSGDIGVVVGFVHTNTTVRDAEDPEVTANMVVMASNMMMDPSDKSMWDVRKGGATGSYLVKQGEEDLSELMHLAHARKSGFATMATVAHVEAKAREFASFVDVESAEMDYGYIVESKLDAQGHLISATIMPVSGSDSTVEVAAENLVILADLEGEDTTAFGVETAALGDRSTVVEYYKQAYKYAPDYIAQVIKTIDDMSFA